MPKNYFDIKRHNKEVAKRLYESWERFISTSEANLNFPSEARRGKMIPCYWYDSNDKIIEGPDIYDTIADGMI